MAAGGRAPAPSAGRSPVVGRPPGPRPFPRHHGSPELAHGQIRSRCSELGEHVHGGWGSRRPYEHACGTADGPLINMLVSDKLYRTGDIFEYHYID